MGKRLHGGIATSCSSDLIGEGPAEFSCASPVNVFASDRRLCKACPTFQRVASMDTQQTQSHTACRSVPYHGRSALALPHNPGYCSIGQLVFRRALTVG